MAITHAQRQIISDLRGLGVVPGNIIMVHASFKSLGRHGLDPEAVIDTLIETIGPRGTLLMPALSYEDENAAYFSVRDTPSDVGILSEVFRKRQGVLRSCHPTHSVCGRGPAAETLLADHHMDNTPCGIHSPFSKILDMDARIVMLGCTLRPNTTMHALEEIAGTEYLLGDECIYRIQTVSGKTYTKTYIKHGFKGYTQEYDRIVLLSGDEPFMRTGAVLDAKTYIIDTRKMKGPVLSILGEDPLFFVSCISSSPP